MSSPFSSLLSVLTSRQDRKYLDYDLAGLYSYIKQLGYSHIFIGFEDSEGFDSALLSELILLLKSVNVSISACNKR